MGAESGWRPIKVSEVAPSGEENGLTREQIVSLLNATDPDSIERAGQAFRDAADLVGYRSAGTPDFGAQSVLASAAKALAEVWSGQAAAEVQGALRKAYATAEALGTAMIDTGSMLAGYAVLIRGRRAEAPTAGDAASDTQSAEGDPDAAARRLLREINEHIVQFNNGLPDGLAVDLPAIDSLSIDPQRVGRITVPGATSVTSGTHDSGGYGGRYGDTGAGAGRDAGSNGASGGADGSAQGDAAGTAAPDGGTGADASDASDASGSGSGVDRGTGAAPPVIGGDGAAAGTGGDGQNTSLADISPSLVGAQGGSPATSALTSMPAAGGSGTTTPGGTLPPGGLIGANSGGPGVGAGRGTGYGSGGAGPEVPVAAMRGAAGGEAGSVLPLMPMGGAGGDQQQEQDRTIYDPDSDIWQVTGGTSPGRIG